MTIAPQGSRVGRHIPSMLSTTGFSMRAILSSLAIAVIASTSPGVHAGPFDRDSSFGNEGFSGADDFEALGLLAMAVDNDSNVYLFKENLSNGYSITKHRGTDGAVDTGFGIGGTITGINAPPSGGYSPEYREMAYQGLCVDPVSKDFLIVGSPQSASPDEWTVETLRIDTAGRPRTGWGTEGRASFRTVDIGSATDCMFKDDGGAFIVGLDQHSDVRGDAFVAQLTANGTLQAFPIGDPVFAVGRAADEGDWMLFADRISPATTGGIVVAGYARQKDSGSEVAFVFQMRDGALTSDFNNAEVWFSTADEGGLRPQVTGMRSMVDGSVTTVTANRLGSGGPHLTIGRLDRDGNLTIAASEKVIVSNN